MPASNRPARVGDLIRSELATLLARVVRDPGVRLVTVTRVQMAKDLQHARVFYTVSISPSSVSSPTARREAAGALRRARPFLKRRLGQLGLRHVPELSFVYDDALEQQDRVAQLLDELHTEVERPDDDDQNPAES